MISGKSTFLKNAQNTGSNAAPFHRAKKSLGQNFLVDDNISRKIVVALSPTPEDSIIEIGPGQGALTRLLAESRAQVTAVEKDRELAKRLSVEFAPFSNVRIINADFLDYAFPVTPDRYKVVGNIPYNLTSKIVSRLVDLRQRINLSVLMVQDEVAERLAAKPGTKAYGAISIRLQLAADIQRLFVVTPGCFRPRPSVDSRVIRIAFREWSPSEDEEKFVRFVKEAFSSRRKMFRYLVARRYGKESVSTIETKFTTARVETFTPTEIYNLFETLERDARHK